MFGPFTPTLLALLTRKRSLLKLPVLKRAAEASPVSQLCAGKIAVITGAAGGIGAALSKACARHGCNKLVLSDLHWSSDHSEEPDRHPLVTELRSKGAEVLPLVVDVGRQEGILSMRDAVLQRFGPPHFLFNNAGVGMPGLLSASDDALARCLDINLLSVVHGMRAFVGPMESLGDNVECHIVNTASLAGISESTGMVRETLTLPICACIAAHYLRI